MAIRTSAVTHSYTDALGLGQQNVFTFCCWARIAVDRNDFSTCLNVDGGALSDSVCFQTTNDGVTMRIVYNDSNADNMTAMTVGTWYFLAVSVNSTTATAYYRAATATTLTSVAANPPSAGFGLDNIVVGDAVIGSSQWWNGDVAHVKLWNGAALTAAELHQESQQAMPSRTTNLTGWWPLTNVNDTTDYSGNGFTLTPTGSAATSDGPPIAWIGGGWQPLNFTEPAPAVIDANAEQTTHTHTTGDSTPSVGSTDQAAPATTHTTADVTATGTTSAGAPATTHTTETPAPRIAVTDTTAPANGHTTNTPTANVGATDQAAPALAHTTHPVGATATTAAGTTAAAHDAGQPTPTLTTTDTTAPAVAHTTYDATVSTVADLDVSAGHTTHTHTTDNPGPAQSLAADTTSTSHNAPDATTALTLPAGTGAHSHTAGDALGAIGAPTETAPHTHTTPDVVSAMSVGAEHVPTAHATHDATPDIAFPVFADAEQTTTTHTAYDATVTLNLEVFPGVAPIGVIAHIPIGGMAQSFFAELAALTHTTPDAVAGVGKHPQDAPHTLEAFDAHTTLTTAAGLATVALVAYTPTVDRFGYVPAYSDVDTASGWADLLDKSSAATEEADQYTLPTSITDAATRATHTDSTSVPTGIVG